MSHAPSEKMALAFDLQIWDFALSWTLLKAVAYRRGRGRGEWNMMFRAAGTVISARSPRPTVGRVYGRRILSGHLVEPRVLRRTVEVRFKRQQQKTVMSFVTCNFSERGRYAKPRMTSGKFELSRPLLHHSGVTRTT